MSDLEYFLNGITIDNEDLLELAEKHVNLRIKYSNEMFLLLGLKFPTNVDVLNIVSGNELNNQNTFNFIKERLPNYLILYGAPLIKQNILDLFKNRVINFHLGLSEYYRGSVSNLMALYNNEYTKVGATIHEVVKKIDGGNIIETINADYLLKDDLILLPVYHLIGMCLALHLLL